MRPLLALLRIEEGEGRAVGLCFLQAVFLGVPRLFTVAAGAALFLARHPAEDVPWVYIAASLLLPAAGLLHLAASRRAGFVPVQIGTLLVLAAVPAAFLLLLRSSDGAWPAFALFVWCGAELHLSNVVLWSTANRLFTVRQGKRLFGLLGAGEIVAALAGGAAIPALTGALGAAGLLLVSVAGFLLAAAGLSATARAFPDRLASGPEPADAGGHEVVAGLRDRFLGLIFLTFALVLSAGFFVNSIFYFQVKEAYPTAAAAAVFLGRFAAAASVLGLLLRSLLSSRFLLRFGLLGGLVATPAALLLGALFVLHAGRAGAPEASLFTGVVALRLLERLLSGALGQPAYYSLYQPLSRARRARVQTAAETIAGPIAGGATGAALLFLTKGLGLGAVGLTAALLPLLAAWLVVAVGVGRAFPAALSAALRRPGATGGDLSLTDPESLRVLEKGLDSPRPPEVLHCLRLLEEAEHPGLGGILRRLADHASPDVRGAVYGAIARNAGPAWLPLLAERRDGEQGAVLGSLLRALGACGRDEARPLLEAAFASSDGEARRGALVALVRHAGGGDGGAARELRRLAASAEPSERATAARALGEIGGASAAEGLAPLLADPDAAVRKAALRAASAVGGDALLRLAIPLLEDPALRPEALRTLLAFPSEASAALVAAWQGGAPPRLRRLVVQALGRLRDPAAARFLAGELAFVEGASRTEVLWSLHLCGFRAAGAQRRVVESCFREEVRRGTALVAARRDLAGAPGAELLAAALRQELARTQKRIFLLLSLLHDAEALLRIWSSFSVSPALRDLSLELFESRVDRAHARLALPVLAETPVDPPAPPAEQLRRVLLGTRPRAGEWIRACAVDALGGREELLAPAERDALLSDADPLVRETARARLAGERDGRLPAVERVRVLRATGLFGEIDDEVLAEIAPRLAEVAAEGGEELPREGEGPGALHVVAAGRLEPIGAAAAPGPLGPGSVFGELSALDPGAEAERARALEPSLLLRLAGPDLADLLSTRIEVVRGVIASLCRRARAASAGRTAGTPAAPERRPRPAAPAWAAPGEGLSPVDRLLVLRTAEIFAEVPDEVLADVAGRTREVRLRRNEVLFRKGDPGTTTYVVASGRLKVHVGERVVAEVGERAVVGELAALSSEPRTADVTALDDALLLTLDQESLFDLMLDRQEIARGVIRVLAARVRGDAPPAGDAGPGLIDSVDSRTRATRPGPAGDERRE